MNHVPHLAAQAGRVKLLWRSKWSSALSDGFFLCVTHFSLDSAFRTLTVAPRYPDQNFGIQGRQSALEDEELNWVFQMPALVGNQPSLYNTRCTVRFDVSLK